MRAQSMDRVVRSLLVCGLASIGLTGCEYWPPALQAQIEQMQVEAQLATAERAKLQGQLADAMKMKEELQVRVDELTRANREFSGRVSTLEQALSTERKKGSRLAEASHKSAPTSTAMKPSTKASHHKKSMTKTKTKTLPKKRVYLTGRIAG